MADEREGSIYESPAMQQVQDILADVKHYTLLQQARPGQTVVGERTEHGFRATALCGEYELQAVPNERVTRLVNKLREEIPPEKQLQLAETMRLVAKSGDGAEFVKRLIEKQAGDGEK